MFFSGTCLTLKLYAGSRFVPASFVGAETHNPRLTSRPFAALTITPVTDFSAIPVERGGAAVRLQSGVKDPPGAGATAADPPPDRPRSR